MAASSYPPFRLDATHPRSSKRSKVGLEYEQQEKREKSASEMRITELLARNVKFELLSKQHQPGNAHKDRPMEGDIPALALRNEFFMGVKIGWPFPEMLKPQRLMALHIIKGLNSSKHVVLESPTGTGKSAAILCSALAWQRFHEKTTNEKVRIIYCSRTHSQVAQMVESLQKTPYRPTMTVLGSRDRMCIHEGIREAKKNVNNECRSLVKATEAYRKSMLKNAKDFYNDQDPPTYRETDDLESPHTITDDEQKDSTSKPTCPHYRQLGASRTAENMIRNFRPPSNGGAAAAIAMVGDESSKMGTHDIEDLVEFGRNPYKRSVVLKKRPEETWGMTFSASANAAWPYPVVSEINPQGRVAKSGAVKNGDMIFSVNHRSTASRDIIELGDEMRQSHEKLILQVGTAVEEVSQHSACPYYISRALEKHAELVFCPYNYILDPMIRKALEIGLEGTVVVLDEAHNVEDTLRDGGSGKWSEIELCTIISALQYYAGADSRYAGEADIHNETVETNEMAHELVVFLEKIVLFMLDGKRNFEKNGGAEKALDEWRRFHTPDGHSFEMSYDGPNGYGIRGESVGCRPFFEKLAISPAQAETLRKYAEAMCENVQQREDIGAVLQRNLFDQMVDLVTKLTLAMEQPHHYFVQTTVQANGSFQFASGEIASDRQWQRKPKSLPLAHCRSANNRNALVDPCRFCRDKTSGHELIFVGDAVRHGSYNNNATPPWESFLVLELLTPALFMADLARKCRSVILASGSLAPLPSLCAELGLRASSEAIATPAALKIPAIEKAIPPGRLQDRPPPLEADHVINLKKQLLAVAIGQFPNGDRLTVNYNHYKEDSFLNKLGDALAAVIESIPRGGVLVFLSSYSLLRRCTKAWNPESSYERYASFDNAENSAWSRFIRSKGKVIVEPTGSQADFEAARNEYADAIRTGGSCILFAVFRGKMSEGISFNDDNARGVICVGIPFPSSYERSIKAKKSYNDEQRKLFKRTELLPGDSWYQQQAYRAIAQALGRCIRHAGDYGTVILMDSRHCDESPPDQNGLCIGHRQLPKWMRSHVKTLVSRVVHDNNGKTIGGGWTGLKATMQSFFQEAPVYSAEVLRQQSENLRAAQERANKTPAAKFNNESGQWSITPKDSSNVRPTTNAVAASVPSFSVDKPDSTPPSSGATITPLHSVSVKSPPSEIRSDRTPVVVARSCDNTQHSTVTTNCCTGNSIGHPSNTELIEAFDELSELYFKSGYVNTGATYKKVVASLRGIAFAITAENAKGLAKGGDKVAGIGKASADKIHEFVTTGKIEKLEEKRAEVA